MNFEIGKSYEFKKNFLHFGKQELIDTEMFYIKESDEIFFFLYFTEKKECVPNEIELEINKFNREALDGLNKKKINLFVYDDPDDFVDYSDFNTSLSDDNYYKFVEWIGSDYFKKSSFIYKGKYKLKFSEQDKKMNLSELYGIQKEDYDTNAKQTYGKFVIEGENYSSQILLSMTSKNIINQEIEILKVIDKQLSEKGELSNNLYENYHTYFFELVLDKKSKRKFFQQNNSVMNDNNRLYQITFIEESENSYKSENNNEDIYTGQLFVANSPFEIASKKVLIKKILKSDLIYILIEEHDKLKEKVFKKYTKSLSDIQVKATIDHHIGTNVESVQLEHYYLGQANSSKIVFQKFKGYYDIGYSLFFNQESKSQQRKIQHNENEFNKEDKVDFFIISHIHFDHIAGICNFNKKSLIQNSPLWLIQNILEFNHVAKYIDSIIIFLILNKVNLFLLNYNNDEHKNDKIHIKRNLCCKGKNINQTSIVVRLKSKNESFLFTGDSSYRYFNSVNFGKQYDYIHICHHGTKLNGKDKLELINLKKIDAVGICSVGENEYKHPNKKHLKLFTSVVDIGKINGLSSYKHILK